jgi:hypothetical protein
MFPALEFDSAGLNLLEQAKAALSHSRIHDIRRLKVLEHGDGVLLKGQVGSYYHKQLAQELVRNAIEGGKVANEIDVRYRPED